MTLTDKQSRAYHLWCERYAEALNDAGYSQQVVLDLFKDLPWSQYAFEEFFKTLIELMWGHTSHKQLSHDELNQMQDILADRLPVFVDFPHIEEPVIYGEEEYIKAAGR